MPFTPVVQSTITRQTTSVSGTTFDTPIFAATHMYFPEISRVRSYNSWDDVKDDTDVVVNSPSYLALRLSFSQSPAPSTIFLGRRKADDVTLTPSPVSNLATYSVTLAVTEDIPATTVTTVSSVVSDADATAVEISAALALDMITTNPVADVTVTDETGSIKVVPDSGFSIQIKSLTKLVDTYTTTETASALLTAIQAENDDWYFMCAEDHTETFQLAMAASIEATASSDFPKMYFTSTQDANVLVTLPDPAVEIIGKLKALNYVRTVADWHDNADILFPEMGDVGFNGSFAPGTTTWKFMQVVGVTAAADPVTGKTLSTPKQGFIDDRNGGWMGIERGVNFYHEGKTVGGEFIDITRAVDFLNDEIEKGLLNLLLNQKGGKIPYTNAGTSLIRSTVDTVLDAAVLSGILSGYTPTTIPDTGDIAFADKVARILKDVKWVGFLAGAVHSIIVDGNLTFEEDVLV